MANIKKNFNFRNGVQVDDDNLLVTSTGLVGIGTTVPTEALDVRGNVKIIGDATITNATVGILTLTEVVPTQIIGAGVSIKSGIVTAQGTGIVTFFGDARFLQGMPTSQWEDTNAGFGVSSIYNTGGTVGIATTSPQSTLQVGDNVDAGERGVGISSAGNINASGIISATTFSGGLTGDVTGNVTGNLTGNVTGNTQGIHTGAVDFNDNVKATFGSANEVELFHKPDTSDFRAELSDTNLVILSRTLDFKNQAGNKATITVFEPGGISEVRLFNDGNEKLRTTGYGVTIFNQLDTTNLNVSGVSTFSGAVDINADLDVDGHTNLDNVSISGVTTSSGNINLPDNVNLQFGDSQDLKIYHGLVGGHSYIENTTGSIRLKNGGSTALEITSDGTTGINNLTVTQGVNVTGVVTATTELNSPLIGVGTDAPANDIQVRKSGNAEIQVTSDTGVAGLTVGREASTGNTNNAEFRYGGGSGAPYSSAQSLDILNYGTGNFNYHLSAANPSGVNGDFHWHKGLNTRLMTLTGIGGSLGIGVTVPSAKFEVAGSSKFTGSVEITNNLTLSGALNANINGNVTGNLTGNVFGLIDTPVTGISTINNLRVGQGIGIGITDSGNKINIGSSLDNRIFINNDSQIGIKTDRISETNIAVEILGNVRLKKAVSVGDTTRSAVDFSDAVNITNEGETGLPFNRSQLAYMIPPRVDNAQRNLLRDAHTNSATLLSGAMIFNTDINKLQVYNGTSWETVTSS